MSTGNFTLVLHTHLPYVLHHGDWPHGTDWLCEAVVECYIPLLNVFNELVEEGITPNVSLDISPVLCEQLEHHDFAPIFLDYCDRKIASARTDAEHFLKQNNENHYIPVAEFWEHWYSDRKQNFIEKYNSSVVGALRNLQERGAIEILTCGASHGYYPLLGEDASIDLQMCLSKKNYEKHFGCQPQGTWLPECGYRPSYPWRTYLPIGHFQMLAPRAGTEQLLAQNNLKFFIVDQQTTEQATALGILDNGNFTSVFSQDFQTVPFNFDKSPLSLYHVSSDEDVSKGTAIAFTRHQKIAMQVWSGDSGYPGDPNYLDFHKKHFRSAIRYWRVTDNKADMQYKLLYVRDWALEKIKSHAYHFAKTVEATLLDYKHRTGKTGTLCTPFDTELFGHWWFEGPDFIKEVLRGLHYSSINVATCSQVLAKNPPKEVMAIQESSWGEGGNHNVWMNEHTEWTWYLIYDAEKRFRELMNSCYVKKINKKLRRLLTQALKELLLLQSSDWQFLITTVSAKDYAEKRFVNHHSDFTRLCDLAEQFVKSKELAVEDNKYLDEVENRDSIFPELTLELYVK